MKILVIMKRFGANKDMVLDDFGRQIRLFEPLVKKHTIHFLCPDYTKKESKTITRKGIKFTIRPVSIFSLGKFLASLKSMIKNEKYNFIVATTDPLIGIIGNYYSKKYRIPLIYDLQDNFESYDTYKLPFVNYLDKKAVKEADMVLTVSNKLKEYISRFRKKPIHVIQNGIDLKLFKHVDKKTARKKLKLSQKSKILVYIGHLEKLKGGNILLDAFKKIREDYPDTYLLLSGKIDKSININQKNVIFRKFSKREEVVLGLNASDVAILPNPSNNFTKYCFPYKLIEYMASNVPIVATDVGDVSLVLKKYPGSLCKPNDSKDLAEKIIEKLGNYKSINYSKILKQLTWKKLSDKIDMIIKRFNHKNYNDKRKRTSY